MKMIYNAVICRYHEIATKGNNRNMFERCLVDNIKRLVGREANCRVLRVRGRVWIERHDGGAFSPGEIEHFRQVLPRAFGLESFSPAVRLPVDMEKIRGSASELARELFAAAPEHFTFRIRARRSNKRFSLTSNQIEVDLITRIGEESGEKRFTIDLDRADYTLGVEVRDEFSALYLEQLPGPGGLPVGSNPRVLTLLSGGIDSPVAAYLAMKRGSGTAFLSFHSAPYTPPESVEKVKRLAAILNTYQRPERLFAANLSAFQREVRDRCRDRYRTVLYRRAMMRIAEMIAERYGYKALVTGEALGQVASQTIDNLNTINRAVNILILRPLIGADKLESIRIAERIGTMEISSEQVPDSCTVFAPANPATAVPLDAAEEEEAKIPDYAAILAKIVDEVEIFTPGGPEKPDQSSGE